MEKLARLDSDKSRFIYDLMMRHADSMTTHVHSLSYDEFMASAWPRTMYFGYEDDSGELACIVSLVPDPSIDRSAEMGVVNIKPRAAQDALFALFRFAFNTLGLHRLYGKANADNPSLIKMAERMKIRCEGRNVRAFYKNGEWIDQLLFAVTAEEDTWRG